MATSTGKQKCAKGKSDIGRGNAKGVFDVDPAHIRFTHSGISPKFADGRSVHDTWEDLQAGRLLVGRSHRREFCHFDDTPCLSLY